MSSTHGFAASVLEASAAGYGGIAASLLIERHPEVDSRWGEGAFTSWKAHLTQRILELAAALRVEESTIFASRVDWARRALVAREMPDADLALGLGCLREVLAEQLPAPAGEIAGEYIDAGLAILASEPVPDELGLDPESDTGRLTLAYLAAILEGRPRQAIDLVLDAVDGGLAIESAYLEVLLPAQREIGRLWHLGSVSVAEEHLVTVTTARTMALVGRRRTPADPVGCRVLVAGVQGNAHDIAIRALADLLELDGWEVVCLGGDVPTVDLIAAATGFGVDLVILGCSLTLQVQQLETAIRGLKRLDEAPAVLVGGPALDEAPGLWNRLGADGYSATLPEAMVGARDLVA